MEKYVQGFIGLRVEDICIQLGKKHNIYKELGDKALELQSKIAEKLGEEDSGLLIEYEDLELKRLAILQDILYKKGFEDCKNIADSFIVNMSF